MADLVTLAAWLVLLVVFGGMFALCWRLIRALDEALARGQTAPPPSPVAAPAPPVIPPAIPHPTPIPAPATPPAAPAGIHLTKQIWPHEVVPASLDAFYGNPRGPDGVNPQWAAANLTTFTFPWKVKGSQTHPCHVKVKASLDRILAWCWDHVGRDQAKIDAAHLDEFSGSFNYRPNVNQPSKLSLHSYGIALDFAAAENPNGKAWVDNGVMLPRWFISAFLAEGWSWGGDFNVTKDPMHFQATFNSHPDAPQDQPHGGLAPAPSGIPSSLVEANVTATVFGGAGDPNTSAYDNHVITDTELGVALPFHFQGARPDVRVTNPATGQSVVCKIVDVGPWNVNDPYWLTGARPQAESGFDLGQVSGGVPRKTNHAGIDLTPAAAKALGIEGKGLVSWQFENPLASTPTT
jgi:hypothetical protein